MEDSRRVLWISPYSNNRDEALSDLTQILGEERVGFLPAPKSQDEVSPYERRIFRARALQNWTSSKPFALVTEPASVWLNLLPSPDTLDHTRIILKPGDILNRDHFTKRLHETGYTRVDLAENRGDYALRGYILDVYPFTHDLPLRLEFLGNRLESLRSYDPQTQRTIAHLDLFPLFLTQINGESGSSLATYITADDILFIEAPEECEQIARRQESEESWGSILSRAKVIYRGSIRQDLPRVDFKGLPQMDFGGHIGHLAENLSQQAKCKIPVYIACDNEGQSERLEELLFGRDVAPMPRFFISHLSGGFFLSEPGPILYTDHQIFRRPRRRRAYFRLRNFSPIDHADTLKHGDFIVHEDYGIGRFLGLKTIEVGYHARECLQIEYAKNTKLYVRLESLRKVQKYSGREGFIPPLTRIGKGEWEKIRKRTEKAVQELAEDLLQLYALRASREGYAFPKDNAEQFELEAGFEYEETPDQLRAITDVKKDMEKTEPMDRLVCGDVGYGKTEVALRAAYKAVLGGRQVGVLVPTTLLAHQHYQSFTRRLADTAVEIEMLSRFKTTAEQKDIIKRLQSGQIDIIIGTHRLLSPDVIFPNLGLLIIDEEHRFGVQHKERLKKLKTQVDALTLTATPIPRTLHMALIGARDMSVINTAPQDRLPIETEIAPFSQDLITGAILREIDRGGQVYFVHNRVESIEVIRRMLDRWLPQIRFTVAHGQMPERQLERTMDDFLGKKFDCLISTMIIESGLDLPNVNTMIVNRADRFGLAQLYQLRGRIGRSNRQAYAYMLIPRNLSFSSPARKRLEAIRYCSYLGAGFQVAMRDLEIRGAGEIFGAKQSGFIHSVGFDLYRGMLEKAITDLKEDSAISKKEFKANSQEIEPKIEFPFDAFLPNDYVENPEQRISLYRRLSEAQNYITLDSIVQEIRDRYGAPPTEAQRLLDLIELKLSCQNLGLLRIDLTQDQLFAEIGPKNGRDWQKRIVDIIDKLDGKTAEFSGGNPPGIHIHWGTAGDWESRITEAKALLRSMSESSVESVKNRRDQY